MTSHEKKKLKAKKLRKKRQDEIAVFSRLGGDPQVLREKFYKEDRRILRNKKKKYLVGLGGGFQNFLEKQKVAIGDANAITCGSKS